MAQHRHAPVPSGLRAVEIIKDRFKRLPKGMIQIGAHNGREAPRANRSGVQRALFFEPLEEMFTELEDRIAQIDRYRAVQALLGDKDGKTVSFNVASNTGESSSFLEPGKHVELKPKITFGETRTLTMRTLDSLLTENKIDAADYDMLFIDTQGAEKHVLMGASETLKSIDFIWMEVSIGGIYKGDTPLARFVGYFEVMGFELGFCELNHLGWGDALFVRRQVFAKQTT